jgi:hypothetical protein
MDKPYGIFYLSISLALLFHVNTCNTPNDVWKKVEGFVRKERQPKRSSVGELSRFIESKIF